MSDQRYGVIIADPPWEYRNRGNGAPSNHYPTMKTDQIVALPVAELAHGATVLLMWATWPLLPDAIEVGKGWGFDYVSGFPWIKLQDDPAVDLFGDIRLRPAYGTGFWARGCSEMVLVFRRPEARPPAWPWLGLLSKRFEHSRKPDNLYEYAESMPGPYVELFARRARPGWDSWGNEIGVSDPVAGIMGQPAEGKG